MLSKSQEQQLRAMVLPLLTCYVPCDYGDPKFSEIAPNYKEGKNSGTSCGFLCHWLLWKLGCRTGTLINRDDALWNVGREKTDPLYIKYAAGKNISKIFASPAFVPFKAGSVPEHGDIVYIAKRTELEKGIYTSEHVMVFSESVAIGSKVVWRTYDAGQRNTKNQQCARPVESTLVGGGKQLKRPDNAVKDIMGWISLDKLSWDALPGSLVQYVYPSGFAISSTSADRAYTPPFNLDKLSYERAQSDSSTDETPDRFEEYHLDLSSLLNRRREVDSDESNG